MTAAEKMLAKALVGSKLDTKEWAGIQAGLRDRAFFMAQIEDARIHHAARQSVADMLDSGKSQSEVRRDLRRVLSDIGYNPDKGLPEGSPSRRGSIKDLLSKSRLDAIIKTNVEQARGFINYASGIEPGAFAAFPAQELRRIQRRNHERPDWPERWKRAMDKVGGKECMVTPDGRMVALKTSPVWAALSVFGQPFPPFDRGSGMGVMDVSKDDAIKFGLITQEKLKHEVEKLEKRREDKTLPSLTGHLSAKVAYERNSKEWHELRRTFGDFVKYEGDEIKWREDWTESFLRDAGKEGFSFNAGLPTQRLLDVVARDIDDEHARMIRLDRQLEVTDEWLNDKGKHGRQPGHGRKHLFDNEVREGNVKMDNHDLELLPSLWRSPTRADYSVSEDNTLFLEIDTFDGCVIQARVSVTKHGPRLKTIFKRSTSEIEEKREERMAERAGIRAKQKEKKKG